MSAKRMLTLSLAALICGGLAFSIFFITYAQTLGTGIRTDPVVIANLDAPFTNTADTAMATVGPGDPQPSCTLNWPRDMTRWYAFTPAIDMLVRASASFEFFNFPSLAIYRLDPGDNLSEVGCTSDPSSLLVSLSAGQHYLFQVAGQFFNPWPYPSVIGHSVSFNLTQAPHPANDNFANAEVIMGMPFPASPDLSFATMEPSEKPASCWQNWGQGIPPSKSVWYRYTPLTSEILLVAPTSAVVGIFTGSGLDNLVEMTCGGWYNNFVYNPQVGTTYYFQVMPIEGWWGIPGFTLSLIPPPNASFSFNPGDPSIYDPVNFWGSFWDSAGMEFQSIVWNFGDGTSAQGWGPSHLYAADGDYTVNVTVTTVDGRSGSASNTVQVRTHDVAITDFKGPAQVKAGQKHRFVVTLANNRYPEQVQVGLFKNTPSGFILFASLSQDVAVGKSSVFNFDYQFSKSDETQGVNTFQAVATLFGSRDAKLDNNTLTIGAAKETGNLKDWTIFSGLWAIADGKLTSSSTQSESWIWAGSPALSTQDNLTAGFTLNLTAPGNTSWFAPQGGVMFYASVPTYRFDSHMTGYTIELVPYMPYLWDKGIRLSRWDHGNQMILCAANTGNLSNPPQQWLVAVNGNLIRFYGDGVLLCEVQDATYRTGSFGFWAYQGSKIELSNIQIGSKFRALWKK